MTTTRHALGLPVAACLLFLFAAPTSQAIILYWDSARATNAPTSCYYADSGWQYQGQWGNFLGTPIAPQYFITAKHFSGTVGQTFTYNSQTYTTAAIYDSPNSDLRICKISGTFATYAPLYTASTEQNQTMTVFGRGRQRGSSVIANSQTVGWYWSTFDHVQSWGSNIVDSIVTDPVYGSLLYFTFDSNGDWHEGALAEGDSGGGVFIKDGATWKLAGINLATDGPFSLTGQNGTGFSNASIFDLRGLYVGGDNNWMQVPTSWPNPIPAGSYASRISSNLSWIYSVTGPLTTSAPEPTTAALLLLSTATWLTRRRHQ